MAAALPVIQAVGAGVSIFSSLSGIFGGGAPEQPSLPPPPPIPEAVALPPPPKQVTEGAEESLANEQARNRSIRQRRADTQRRGITSLAAKTETLLGE